MARTTFIMVLTGGGSGGHVYPLIAVADAIEKKVAELGGETALTYIGPRDAYSKLFESRGVAVRAIAAGKIRRYVSFENLIDIPKFFIGFVQALWHLYWIMPDAVFSKGGTGAFPVVLAAWFYRIPIAIHESDAQPGLTNVASARFASKIFTSFTRAAQFFDFARTVVSGAPIRPELLDVRPSKESAKETLGMKPDEPLTLVIGGSQGSVRINEFIIANLPGILQLTQVMHQTGIANFADAKRLSDAALAARPAREVVRYKPISYFAATDPSGADDLKVALAAADLVIMRPGGTIFEVASFGDPAILIPIAESANDHQRVNAYEFANAGAGVVIEEVNLLPGIFMAELKRLIGNAELRKTMGVASARFFIHGAAKTIADGIVAMASGR